MKFLTYINENESEIDLPFLFKDVKNEYLKTIYMNGFLYRATAKSINKHILLFPRKDRKPTDTPIVYHNFIDNLFKKKFGWNVRSEGVFTNALSKMFNYGITYLFFPLGPYKYVWSERISDLYLDLLKLLSDNAVQKLQKILNISFSYGISSWSLKDFDYKEAEEIITNDLKNKLMDFYRSNDLPSAIREKHEVVFKCDKYLLIDTAYENLIYNYLDIIYGGKKKS